MEKQNYTDINAKTIDGWVDGGWEWGRPITHEEFVKAKNGEWRILLSPRKELPREWLLPVEGKDVLGLASGGGQQMPVLCALGGRCTVLDYSARQIESEKYVAGREGYSINAIRADMTKPFPFENESFDIIVHPVSNCYIENVKHVWNECFRVLRRGGVLLSGLDNGVSYLFGDAEKEPLVAVNKLPFNPLKNPELYRKSLEGNDGIQFSHSLEEQIGGQLEAGFVLTGLYEDREPAGLLSEYTPQYFVTRAVKSPS